MSRGNVIWIGKEGGLDEGIALPSSRMAILLEMNRWRLHCFPSVFSRGLTFSLQVSGVSKLVVVATTHIDSVAEAIHNYDPRIPIIYFPRTLFDPRFTTLYIHKGVTLVRDEASCVKAIADALNCELLCSSLSPKLAHLDVIPTPHLVPIPCTITTTVHSLSMPCRSCHLTVCICKPANSLHLHLPTPCSTNYLHAYPSAIPISASKGPSNGSDLSHFSDNYIHSCKTSTRHSLLPGHVTHHQYSRGCSTRYCCRNNCSSICLCPCVCLIFSPHPCHHLSPQRDVTKTTTVESIDGNMSSTTAITTTTSSGPHDHLFHAHSACAEPLLVSHTSAYLPEYTSWKQQRYDILPQEHLHKNQVTTTSLACITDPACPCSHIIHPHTSTSSSIEIALCHCKSSSPHPSHRTDISCRCSCSQSTGSVSCSTSSIERVNPHCTSYQRPGMSATRAEKERTTCPSTGTDSGIGGSGNTACNPNCHTPEYYRIPSVSSRSTSPSTSPNSTTSLPRPRSPSSSRTSLTSSSISSNPPSPLPDDTSSMDSSQRSSPLSASSTPSSCPSSHTSSCTQGDDSPNSSSLPATSPLVSALPSRNIGSTPTNATISGDIPGCQTEIKNRCHDPSNVSDRLKCRGSEPSASTSPSCPSCASLYMHTSHCTLKCPCVLSSQYIANSTGHPTHHHYHQHSRLHRCHHPSSRHIQDANIGDSHLSTSASNHPRANCRCANSHVHEEDGLGWHIEKGKRCMLDPNCNKNKNNVKTWNVYGDQLSKAPLSPLRKSPNVAYGPRIAKYHNNTHRCCNDIRSSNKNSNDSTYSSWSMNSEGDVGEDNVTISDCKDDPLSALSLSSTMYPFVVDDRLFPSIDHYMLYYMFFSRGFNDIATRILNITTPRVAHMYASRYLHLLSSDSHPRVREVADQLPEGLTPLDIKKSLVGRTTSGGPSEISSLGMASSLSFASGTRASWTNPEMYLQMMRAAKAKVLSSPQLTALLLQTGRRDLCRGYCHAGHQECSPACPDRSSAVDQSRLRWHRSNAVVSGGSGEGGVAEDAANDQLMRILAILRHQLDERLRIGTGL